MKRSSLDAFGFSSSKPPSATPGKQKQKKSSVHGEQKKAAAEDSKKTETVGAGKENTHESSAKTDATMQTSTADNKKGIDKPKGTTENKTTDPETDDKPNDEAKTMENKAKTMNKPVTIDDNATATDGKVTDVLDKNVDKCTECEKAVNAPALSPVVVGQSVIVLEEYVGGKVVSLNEDGTIDVQVTESNDVLKHLTRLELMTPEEEAVGATDFANWLAGAKPPSKEKGELSLLDAKLEKKLKKYFGTTAFWTEENTRRKMKHWPAKAMLTNHFELVSESVNGTEGHVPYCSCCGIKFVVSKNCKFKLEKHFSSPFHCQSQNGKKAEIHERTKRTPVKAKAPEKTERGSGLKSPKITEPPGGVKKFFTPCSRERYQTDLVLTAPPTAPNQLMSYDVYHPACPGTGSAFYDATTTHPAALMVTEEPRASDRSKRKKTTKKPTGEGTEAVPTPRVRAPRAARASRTKREHTPSSSSDSESSSDTSTSDEASAEEEDTTATCIESDMARSVCPKQHSLVSGQPEHSNTCALCQQLQAAGAGTMRCEECRWECCLPCHTKLIRGELVHEQEKKENRKRKAWAVPPPPETLVGASSLSTASPSSALSAFAARPCLATLVGFLGSTLCAFLPAAEVFLLAHCSLPLRAQVLPVLVGRVSWTAVVAYSWKAPSEWAGLFGLIRDLRSVHRIQGVLLPPSLNRLSFGPAFNRLIPPKILPASLTSLRFGKQFDQPLVEGVFPSSLQQLRFGMNWNRPLAPGVLPASLTSLTFGANFNQPLGVGHLPPQLSQLSFGECYNRSIGNDVLPPKLAQLKFGKHFNQPIGVGVLSKSLTHLSFGENFNQEFEDGVLPPTLRVLVLGAKFNSTLSQAALPASLARIEGPKHLVPPPGCEFISSTS